MDELEIGRTVGRLMAENDQLAAEVARLRAIEARARTTATRPQGHGERAAEYHLRRQLARHILGHATGGGA